MPINVRNSDEKINLEQMFQSHLALATHSTIHTGGSADLAASPVDFEELRALLHYAKENNLPVTVLGGCSNSLISDEGIAGLTILTNHLIRRHVQGEM
ncbi:MAG: FAD-binding protein, partial [Spirochaetia bacterium]|nr:FAD-binding protein [Spirochaetia bacterium]